MIDSDELLSKADALLARWRSGKEKGSTGRPVPLLASFLMKRASRG